jgi:diguanylate cyclase (GGDEF)-like protein
MPNTNTEPSKDIAEKIYAEQISLLYSKSVARPALHIVSLSVFVSVVINHVNPVSAYTWALLLIGLNVYRLIDIKTTQKTINDITDFSIIHKRFAFSAGMLGAVYGFGIAFFFNSLPILNQVYLLLLIAVMTPAGLVSFASDKFSFNMYVYPMVIPPIIWLFVQGQFEYFSIGLYSIIYVLVVNKLFKWNHDTLTDAIRLKIENEQLLNSLKIVNSRLTELSVIDELTQIANRRSLDDELEKEWLRAKRLKTPVSMLMIDIDHFKEYNDDFGHIKGDECLVYVASFMKNNLNRPTDFIARYGGEEFCIIMPDTNMNGAINLAERIHSGIRELKIPNPSSKVSKFLTVCVGVASVVPATDDTYLDLVYSSDKALYKAKNDGRNIIRTTETLEKNPKPQLVV